MGKKNIQIESLRGSKRLRPKKSADDRKSSHPRVQNNHQIVHEISRNNLGSHWFVEGFK